MIKKKMAVKKYAKGGVSTTKNVKSKSGVTQTIKKSDGTVVVKKFDAKGNLIGKAVKGANKPPTGGEIAKKVIDTTYNAHRKVMNAVAAGPKIAGSLAKTAGAAAINSNPLVKGAKYVKNLEMRVQQLEKPPKATATGGASKAGANKVTTAKTSVKKAAAPVKKKVVAPVKKKEEPTITMAPRKATELVSAPEIKREIVTVPTKSEPKGVVAKTKARLETGKKRRDAKREERKARRKADEKTTMKKGGKKC